ncbi:glycosyltransferase family 2 protein [Sphingomonas sp. LR60]|uniref:glycosyltransferase family 2 protein n=1 Tax=Sphingomonas sp. LR60 TaxID=3050233 RepID=UPI002FE1CA6D
MKAHENELVSVIVPAFNAARYLDETLRSIRAQSHEALEIIVVDDGSSDATADIAAAHAHEDARVRVVTQPNGGVARARNTGLSHARGRYVAPIDADDLWSRDKIEWQLDVALAGAAPAALVYSWYVTIDENDGVRHWRRNLPEGDNLVRHMCYNNLVGSGSAPLMLREAVLDLGGYDATLRDRAAQGCEDYKLYFGLIERHPARLVPAYLTAYRVYGGNMSSDIEQMLRSRAIVADEIAQRRPDLRNALERGHVRMLRLLLERQLKSGDRAGGVATVRAMMTLGASATAKQAALLAGRAVRRLVAPRRIADGAAAWIFDPVQGARRRRRGEGR